MQTYLLLIYLEINCILKFELVCNFICYRYPRKPGADADNPNPSILLQRIRVEWNDIW